MLSLRTIFCLCLLGAALTTGCSTPQVVKDSSAQSVAMIRELSKLTDDFKAARQVGDQAVLDAGARMYAVEVENRAALNEALRTRGEKDPSVALYNQVQKLIAGVQQDETDVKVLTAKYANSTAALLKPLPDTSARLTSAAKAVALLGQDLSTSTQVDETLAWLRAVRDDTRENRKKLKQALDAP